jgi:phosphoglycolate phosphatase-like HAD superfamily hydrolase
LERSKSDLLREIVAEDPEAAFVMVGDRAFDFAAAAAVHIPSIGVRWGYGDEQELSQASCIVSRPDELPTAIERRAQPLA